MTWQTSARIDDETGSTLAAPYEGKTSLSCRLCGSPALGVVHNGPIRSGGATSGVEDGFTVRVCHNCGIEFLDPFPPELESYYATPQYWTAHHGQAEVAELQRKHQPEQLRWLNEIGLEALRGKTIADFGCGPGVLLDLVRNVAAATIAVEPAPHFHEHLISRGHRHAPGLDGLASSSLDVIVSFDTLEHVPDPRGVLADMHRVLRDDGTAYIGVPNQADYLKSVVPEYVPFFYHRSHLFYFTADAIRRLLAIAGFSPCRTTYVHKYDLMNMVIWARVGRGQGTRGSDLFDRHTEEAFRTNLERQGIASHFMVEARK